ncbi:MAG: AEC family transporter [Burkholderiaceae bacterium]
MANFVMLAACMLAGLWLRKSARLPDNAHTVINTVILHLSLPALTLRYLHEMALDRSQLLPVLMPWMLFMVGAAVFGLVGRLLQLPASNVGALTLVGGFGNTSFVGLPMIETLHGRDGMSLGLLIDQLGSYLALSTLGVIAAAFYGAQGALQPGAMLRKLLTFPPFIAMVAALLLSPVPFPPVLREVLARIGDTLAPLALLSVGLQLRFDALREHRRLLAIGLFYKLVVCPALVLLLVLQTDVGRQAAAHVTVLEAAMPPMIGAAIIASQANLAPRLVSMMVGLGIPLSFVTVPTWHWLFAVSAALP